MQTLHQGQSEHPQVRVLTRVDSPAFAAVAEALLREGLTIRFVAHGQSMTPSILDGDVVTVAPWRVPGFRAAPGVIVLAATAGRIILHRVVSRRTAGGRDLVVLQGDAAAVRTETVPTNAVLGEAVMVERQGRTFSPNRPADRMAGLLRSFLKRLRTGARWTLDDGDPS